MDYKWRVMNITKMVKLMLLVALVCSCQHSTKTEKAHFQFPQGVASADPQPNAIMLWTRVVDANANPESINLSVEVSESPAFSAITKMMITQFAIMPGNLYRIKNIIIGLLAEAIPQESDGLSQLLKNSLLLH